MYTGIYVKCPLFLSDFNETWIFSTGFSKNIQISNFTKLRPVEAELFHANGWTDVRTDGRTDRQTDMKNLIFAFRHFANAPEYLGKKK